MDAKTIATEGSVKRSIFLTAAPQAAKKTLNITVLMGGPSSERDVSLNTGMAITESLYRLGHRVSCRDISPQDSACLSLPGIDLVFIALHGTFGEDGQVQALCEAQGLRYIGSPPEASRRAMDKAESKTVFRQIGVPTADWVVVTTENQHKCQKAIEALGLPVVIKPIDGGSSVDVTIPKTAADRDCDIAATVKQYGRVMLEQFIRGRELTVGIVGSQALPIIEIIPPGEFYDKRAKYTDCGTKYISEHGLAPALVADIQAKALAAYKALGCRDLSRVDFILDKNDVPYILEINTIPGFTSHSLLPMAARKAGLTFDDLVERVVDLAMQH